MAWPPTGTSRNLVLTVMAAVAVVCMFGSVRNGRLSVHAFSDTQQKQAVMDRVCMDLPGTLLKGTDKRDFGAEDLSTPRECSDWCHKHEGCAQSVFNADGKVCELFGELSEEPERFADGYNSSYCGKAAEQEDLLAKVKKVFKMKPWIPENPNCAWAGENCMESKCCADVCKANWQFTECHWYTCYQKDEYFGSCHIGSAPGNWNGTVLGGHAPMEVPKAPKGVLTQGTKLFCFCVVMWDAGPTMAGMEGEGKVANNFKKMGRSIMQCDDHAFFDGQPTGSTHNIDPFIHAWKMVKKDGRWKHNDWSVKVDADAVFFPNRLRWHIEAARPPQGSVAYMRNCDFKFHFLGALEVLSREAVATYFERGWQCEKKLTKEGGEDYWLLQCLEGIGVNYISDYRLLNDKYAAEENCNDDWAVAFHFYKSSDDWNFCWQAAENAWKAKQKTSTTPALPAPETADVQMV